LRAKQAEFANSLFKDYVLPSTQGVETMKVLSSLAASNFEHCLSKQQQINNQADGDGYSARLNTASVQSEILPEQPYLVQVNREFLERAYYQFDHADPYNKEGNLRKIIDIVNDQPLSE
jgi:hypothetical protein